MKYILLLLTAMVLLTRTSAQQMLVKAPNFSGFHEDKKSVNKLLLEKSSPQAQQHPEFGILPYNAQCSNCVELLDKRTIDSRYFIDPTNARHFYSQKSYFPLHYKKTENDVWHTIDKRLRPESNQPGVYCATNQPVPTKCDLNRKSTSLTVDGFEFEFNKNLSLYFFDENSAYTKAEAGNYSTFSIGEEGLKVKNIWQGMDMQQVFSQGRIETNYVINAPLNLPINSGWMVIEDHFTLPPGYSCVEADESYGKEGYYTGDYEIRNGAGQAVIKYTKPIYLDAKSFGMHGYYNLLTKGNDYTLQTLVPLSWLKSKDNEFPIFIDPLVEGSSQLGEYKSSGLQGDHMAFTSKLLGTCNYTLPVILPGHSTLIGSYVGLEYQLTYSDACDSPAETAPFCTFSQVSQQVICNACNTTTGILKCSPGSAPFTGLCTTDSDEVPGARELYINNFAPQYLSCIPHLCETSSLIFTLQNTDSTCGDVCGFLCAEGNMWQMTIVGVEDSTGIIAFTDSLVSTYPSGNQWYRNDTVLDGDTSAVLVITQAGYYFNSADTAFGCVPDTFYFSNPQAKCSAYFVLFPVAGDTGLYQGYNRSTGDSISYVWSFGDGATSTAMYPYHQYDSAGYYNVCLTVSNNGCTSTFCDSTFYAYKLAGPPMSQLNIINPTGIANVSASPAVSIYPNPASTKLMIRTSNMHATAVTIYDTDGRKVWQQKFAAEIDISPLTPGIYTVEISAPEGSIKKRLEKM
jgi:hypothetical protein